MIEIAKFFDGRLENIEGVERKVQSAFEIIREFPYNSASTFSKNESLEETVTNFLKIRAGSCSPKHYTLGLFYESLGLDVRYLTYPFYWQEQKFKFSPSLNVFTEKMPIQFHTALLINKQGWSHPKLIDATWDKALEPAGVPINFNIFSGHKLGITPNSEPFVHITAQIKWEFQRISRDLTPLNKNISNFYLALNSWLSEIRRLPSL